MKKTSEYLKIIKEAYNNYISNENIDINVCQRIYNYIQNIEYLSKEEQLDLDNFINENRVQEIHLANIYLDSKIKNKLEKQLKKMKPYKYVSKVNDRIYEAKGNFNEYVGQKPVKQMKVKVKRKIHKNN